MSTHLKSLTVTVLLSGIHNICRLVGSNISDLISFINYISFLTVPLPIFYLCSQSKLLEGKRHLLSVLLAHSRAFLNTGTNLKVSFICSPDFWPENPQYFAFQCVAYFPISCRHLNTSETEVQAASISPKVFMQFSSVSQQLSHQPQLSPVSPLSCCISHRAVWS